MYLYTYIARRRGINSANPSEHFNGSKEFIQCVPTQQKITVLSFDTSP